MNGYIQIYTGDGKGKTTAAFGLALRALGAGKKVYIAQFVKGQTYSEIEPIKQLSPNIEVYQYGLECFIKKLPTQEDIDMAKIGLEKVAKVISEGKYELVILDEANIALYYNLFKIEELLHILKNKPKNLEIVITGRYAPKELLEVADLVTEMQEVKHYYRKGIEARKGIEY